MKKSNRQVKYEKTLKESGKSVSKIVQSGWDKIFSDLINAKIYTKEKTIEVLKQDDLWKKFLGKSGNRKAIKYDISLYKSVLHWTEIMNTLPSSWMKNFSARMKFLVEKDGNVENLKCKCGKIWYSSVCQKCYDGYPSKIWFQKTYGDLWISAHDDFLKSKQNNFLKKSYSKVSQRVFWEIYNRLDDKSHCHFAELNREIFLRLDESTSRILNQQVIFFDFVRSHKVIEFDGDRWHIDDTKEAEEIRDRFAKENGYSILRIKESEYYKDPEKVISECLKYLGNTNSK